MQLPAEARLDQSGIPGDETFRYCKTCDAQFEDYDERYGRVIQFCSFCGDRLVRSILGDVNNLIRPVNISPAGSVLTPIQRGGAIGRRSHSPHTHVQDNSVERFRSRLSQLQGAKRQNPPTTDNISNSQRTQPQNLKHGLESSANHENKKAKIAPKVTIETGGKQGKEGGGLISTKGVAEERRSQVGESDVPHSHLPVCETTRRVQAVSQVKVDSDPLDHHQIPARELSYSPEVGMLQRQIERQITAQRLHEEKLEKEGSNVQKNTKEKELEKESAKNEPTKNGPAKNGPAKNGPTKKKHGMIDLTIEDD